MEQIKEQKTAKKDPFHGLDQEFTWINVNALILIGCLKCSGTDSQKAEVFYRVIQPEMSDRILVFDKDIRMAIFFLTNLATILEQMQKEQMYKNVSIGEYKKKMDHYEGVFDAVISDFNDSMFGFYSNSVNRKTFQQHLMSDGWKYFDLNNLNELFSIKY